MPLSPPRSVLGTFLLLLPLSATAQQTGAVFDPGLLAGMEARAIGPAGMSGRVAAIEGVASDPDVIYLGSATGGLWKSENRGLTWEPLFDEQPVAAIGAVAVHPEHPEIVWVGTGEGNVRNSVSVGNGVYRSLDGGRTWARVGLEATERIHRIVLHPDDPDVAFVAAMGREWGENPERGVYRTTDGGETWERVLYVNERTGAAELVMHPENPRVLYAAMWEYRRWPWFFRSGGPGSGLYMTRDGGRNWSELSTNEAFPAGELGRIGIGVAPSNPEVVYALVEAEDSKLLRSDDGGRSWRVVNDSTNIAPRPFYYAQLQVDPERPDRVYNIHGSLEVSDDGGRTFRDISPWATIHPDFHALWIDPEDPEFVVSGNDGGIYFSEDRGETWDFAANLPLAQYYHIRVDDAVPYNVYGGMQDNGSWKGPAAVWENGGIRNHHWEEVGFGDGFDTSPLPDDPMRGYAMSQEGYLIRWNLRTGERMSVRPPPPTDTTTLRFNWNAGFAQDPFDPATIYFGSQFVHRSGDRGESWEIISDDLTTDNPEWQRQPASGGLTPDVTGAENFTTILVIEPSPVERGVLWVGTDDGRLHVTRDGGETWTSVEDAVPDVPAGTWIPHIHASTHAAGTAFVVFDNHRRSDWTTYVYRTDDFGRSWSRLAGRGSGAPGPRTPEGAGDVWGYALSIVQDHEDPDLLFLGTEFGLYVSTDGGGSWWKWTHGVPTVGVRDLAIQARENDLVLGTHGRSAFVLDDYAPLRGLTAATLGAPLHLFDVPDAIQYEVRQTGASRFPGSEEFRGENEPYGALITFSADVPGLPQPEEEPRRESAGGGETGAGTAGTPETAEVAEGGGETAGPEAGGEGPPRRVTVRVLDGAGDTIRTFHRPVKRGVNRIAWNLRHDGFDRPDTGREDEGEEEFFFGPSGPLALPGTYTVHLTLGEHTAEKPVRVLEDPRMEAVTLADRRAGREAVTEAGALVEAAAHAITRLYEIREDVEAVLEKARDDEEEGGAEAGSEGPSELVRAGRALQDSLRSLEEALWVPPETKGIVESETRAYNQARRALGMITSARGAPTEAQRGYLSAARHRVQQVLQRFNALIEGPVAEFRARVEEADLRLFPERETVEVAPPGS